MVWRKKRIQQKTWLMPLAPSKALAFASVLMLCLLALFGIGLCRKKLWEYKHENIFEKVILTLVKETLKKDQINY